MNWTRACSRSGARFNCRSICSIGRLSATAPRSFSALASGRVLPASVIRFPSSTFCVMRTRAGSAGWVCAFAEFGIPSEATTTAQKAAKRSVRSIGSPRENLGRKQCRMAANPSGKNSRDQQCAGQQGSCSVTVTFGLVLGILHIPAKLLCPCDIRRARRFIVPMPPLSMRYAKKGRKNPGGTALNGEIGAQSERRNGVSFLEQTRIETFPPQRAYLQASEVRDGTNGTADGQAATQVVRGAHPINRAGRFVPAAELPSRL